MLAAALLCLPLLAGLAPEAAAQTIDSSTIEEGETKTFTVSGIPQTWTGAAELVDQSTGTSALLPPHGCALYQQLDQDGCYRNESWDSAARTFTFVLEIGADSLAEGSETFVFQIVDADNGTRHSEFTITITEPAADLPEVTIAPKTTGAVTEGGSLEYTLTASTAPTSALTVNVEVTNPPGASYWVNAPTTVEIAANTTSADFTVATAPDSRDEPSGPVTVTVSIGTGYTVGTASSASVTVNDNDATRVTLAELAADTGNVTEGGTMQFTITLFRGLYDGEVLPVPLTITGTAVRGTDYTLHCAAAPTLSCANLNDPNATATVTFAGPSGSGTSANTITLTLRAINDGSVEGDETVDIDLGTLNASSGTNLGGGASATDNLAVFDIENQDLATGEFKVAFDGGVFQFPEIDGFATITGAFGPAPTEDGRVRFRYDSLTATANRDFRAVHSIGYRAGQKRFAFRIPLVQDALIEDNEIVQITRLDPPDGVTVGSTDLIILNSDAPIVSGNPSAVAGEPVRVLLRMATAGVRARGPAVVRVETVESSGAGAATEGTDYTAVDRNVTIPAEIPFAWVEIPTAADGDTAAETFTLKFSLVSYAGTTYAPEYWPNNTSQGAATATIHPSGTAAPVVPAVAIEADPAEVQEGGDAVFTLTARPKPANDLMVSVLLDPKGGNFLAPEHRGRELVAAIDAATGTGTLTVPTLEDPADRDGAIVADLIPREFSKVAAVMQSLPYRVQGFQSKPRAALTVTDRPARLRASLPATALDVDPALVAEVRDLAGQTHNGTAHVNRWRRVLVAFGVESYPGLTPMTAAEAEANAESYSSPLWPRIAKVLADAQNAQTPPTLTLAADAASVTEGGEVSFTITADKAPQQNIEVYVTAEEHMGADGDRISVGRSEPVTFPAGATSVKWTFTAYSDDDERADGTIEARIDPDWQNSYEIGTPSTATMALIDDDGTSDDGGTSDSVGTQQLTPLAVDPALVAGVRDLAGQTHHGTAHVNRWRRVLMAFGLETYPGLTPMTAAEAETNAEKYSSPLWPRIAKVLADAQNTQTPPPPDPAVTVTAGASPVTEGADATFTITANPAPQAPLAVTVAVAASGDYGISAGDRTVTIPTGGSYTLTLATTDDTADEPDGSATATVKPGSGYTVGSPASGNVVIRDDDLPPPVITIAAKTASVTEGGNAVFTVTADRAPVADLPVGIAVAESGGGDHVAAQHEGARTATVLKGQTTVEITVPTVDDSADEPNGTVTATLKGGSGYTLGGTTSASVAVADDDDAAALPTLSIPQALAGSEGESIKVTVSLSRPATEEIRLWLGARETVPASATGRDDFIADGYWVVFRPGQTVQNRWWYLFDDSHDDGGETFEVYIAHVSGPASVGNGVATVTIENDDPLPAAWLKRFGRTVAQQALDGITARIAAPREAGMQGTIAGQALSFDPTAGGAAGPGDVQPGASGVPAASRDAALAMADIARGFDRSPGGTDPFDSGGSSGFGAPLSQSNAMQSRTMTARDALLGSSFSLTGEKDGAGGSLAFWGRASQGSFDGKERGDGTGISLDGTVTTGMLGADYGRGRWLLGLALTQSSAEGDYAALGAAGCPPGTDGQVPALCDDAVRAGDGKIEALLTAAIPYAALQASERLKLWGAAGYGSGEVTVKTDPGARYKADTTWTMAAAGMRSDLLVPAAPGTGSGADGAGSGPAMALTSDALWTRTTSEKTRDLAASESDTTRLRLGLEGSYRMALEGGGSLVPKLEVGARHDGGDAESGFGVELGGGIAWSDPQTGLSLDLSGRTLLAHEDSDFEDRGYAASLAFDPAPATGRGPSLSLRQDWGSRATGGLDALFAPDPLAERTGNGGSTAATSRWSMEAAYGFPAFGGRWTGSPHAGFGLATTARDYSVGWRLAPEAANAPDLSFGVRATRRESDAAEPEHTIGFEVRARW